MTALLPNPFESFCNCESSVGNATPDDRSASASARSLADRFLDEIEAEFGSPNRFRLDERAFMEAIEEKPLFLRNGT